MTDEQDQEPIIELEAGPTDPEDRARILAETAALADARDARYRHREPDTPPVLPWRPVAAGILFALAAWLQGAPPAWLRGDPEAAPTVEDRARGLRAHVYLQAQQIEAFRLREGRLPASLDEVPEADGELRYVRSNSRVYQLVASGADGATLVYDSARPDPAFQQAVPWAGRP